MTNVNLCSLHHVESKKPILEVKQNVIVSLVLQLIGAAFVVTGLYLMLGGIGTIAAFSGGLFLGVAGLGLIAHSFLLS